MVSIYFMAALASISFQGLLSPLSLKQGKCITIITFEMEFLLLNIERYWYGTVFMFCMHIMYMYLHFWHNTV